MTEAIVGIVAAFVVYRLGYGHGRRDSEREPRRHGHAPEPPDRPPNVPRTPEPPPSLARRRDVRYPESGDDE